MEAERKLQGAAYHFQRMEETYLKNEESFPYELEAFLVSARSVPDVLLEDFNIKFSLGVPLEVELFPRTFERKAEELRNDQALNFIQWWRTRMQQIRSEPLGAMLFGKRNIAVHRKLVRPDLKKITLTETIRITDSLTITKYDERGNFIEEVRSQEKPLEQIEPKPTEIDWFFGEYPNENVLEVCRKLLGILKGIIEEAKERFI